MALNNAVTRILQILNPEENQDTDTVYSIVEGITFTAKNYMLEKGNYSYQGQTINNTIVGCIITPPMDNKIKVAYYIGDAKEEELVD